MRQYYVKYKCQGFGNKDFMAGPYKTYAEAALHERDIAGYEGVYDVRVESEGL